MPNHRNVSKYTVNSVVSATSNAIGTIFIKSPECSFYKSYPLLCRHSTPQFIPIELTPSLRQLFLKVH